MATTSSELLAMIQTGARSGTLLQSCALEVKELMVQIDGLIASRQKEWEREITRLKAQLQHRERDISLLKVKLQERNSQLEQLSLQSTSLQQDYKARNVNYEDELSKLRSEVFRLSEAYRRHKAKRSSQSKPSHREPLVSNPPQDVASSENRLSRGTNINEELRVQVKEKDQMIAALCLENETLKEKLGLFQETVMSKDELVRALEDKLSFAHSSAHFSSCQANLCQVQDKLKCQLTLERSLREELNRLKQTDDFWSSDHDQRSMDNETKRKGSEKKETLGFVEEFVDYVDSLGPNDDTLVTLEPTDTGHLDRELESVLQRHFHQLDVSLQNLLEVQCSPSVNKPNL